MNKVLLISPEGDPKEIRGLLGEGFSVDSVKDPGEGLSYVERNHDPLVILMDTPSRMEGVREFVREIGDRNNYLMSIPVLLLTAEDTIREDMQFLDGAAVDCLRRPFIPEILRLRVRNAIHIVSSASFGEFAQMLKALPANIYLKDAMGRYVFSSQTWHHLDTGDDPFWTIQGKTDLDIRKDKENARKAMESDRELMRSRKGTSYVIEENGDGQQEFLQIIKEPLFREDGKVRGIIALINNVTEQELLRRELRTRSITDQLTGIYNRSYFEEYLQLMSSGTGYPLTILSADCDGLKEINDTFGHTMGDEYIRLSVTLMKTILPENSLLFRTGGDEFVCLLPGVDEEKAGALIREMKKDSESFKVQGRTLSVSFGFSTLQGNADDLSEHLKHSDREMYKDKQAKKRGC